MPITMHRPRRAATIGLAAAALVLTAAVSADAATAQAGTARKPAPLCHASDVAYYFGQTVSDGMNALHVDITAVAQPHVTCRLSDKPLLTFTGPKKKAHIGVHYLVYTGRDLTLSPGNPLHTELGWDNVDVNSDQLFVSTVELRMPGGGTTYPVPFPESSGIKPYPQAADIARVVGISVLPWTTGPGQGEGTMPS